MVNESICKVVFQAETKEAIRNIQDLTGAIENLTEVISRLAKITSFDFIRPALGSHEDNCITDMVIKRIAQELEDSIPRREV
ncbi:hypothetical protein ACQKK5_19130 [Brevibacillus panacihumi]|uniref:hypothetical protein n=1 Tax=Brevibacillus panacihumi TaxID=497735 RepID=UPI003D065DC0